MVLLLPLPELQLARRRAEQLEVPLQLHTA